MKVYDLMGHCVATIQEGFLGSGIHVLYWNGLQAEGTEAPPGMYLFYAKIAGARAMTRIVRLR